MEDFTNKNLCDDEFGIQFFLGNWMEWNNSKNGEFLWFKYVHMFKNKVFNGVKILELSCASSIFSGPTPISITRIEGAKELN